MTTPRLKRNAAQCKRCGEVIESKHRHDCRTCSCWTWDKGGTTGIMVDGGLDYVKRGGNLDDMIDLCEWEGEK